jgi:cytochrome c oxidase assembly protein subunit 11
MSPAELRAANRRLALRLGALAVLALGFGFALAPLYDVFCQLTGINAETGRFAEPPKDLAVDKSRRVQVRFMSQQSPDLAIEFHPRQPSLSVNPGDIVLAYYWIKNLSDTALSGNAIPSVSPAQAVAHFKKIECFCFREQTLAPGEERELAVSFWVDPALPRAVTDVTLSYAFFGATRKT